MEHIKLPSIGMGTWQLKGKTCTNAVEAGLKLGYRFIDTAQIYFNERRVGDGLEKANIPREEIILATKIWISNLSPRKIKRSFACSLKRLKTDYVDILYIHWPAGKYDPEKSFSALNDLVDEGTVRYLGVSNFTIPLLKEALKTSRTPIVANQVEMNPALRIHRLHDFIKSQNLYTIAYSPLGRGNLWNNPILNEISQKHSISIPQLCIVYSLQRGAIPIPKASSKDHLQENLKSTQLSVSLDEEDMNRIDTIGEKRHVNPIFAPDWNK